MHLVGNEHLYRTKQSGHGLTEAEDLGELRIFKPRIVPGNAHREYIFRGAVGGYVGRKVDDEGNEADDMRRLRICCDGADALQERTVDVNLSTRVCAFKLDHDLAVRIRRVDLEVQTI